MATNTASSFTNHTGNGTAGPFNVSFSYLSEAEVDVTVGGVLKTITTHYTFTSATQITFTSGNEPGNGVAIKFQRDTNVGSKKVDFVDGSVLTEIDLDNNANQLLFSMQEIVDSGAGSNVSSVTGTTPIVSSGGRTPAISISAATTSAAGSMSASDKSKLDGIEASATADQTAAEIRTLVESASDSNVFTDADHTKLNGIEASATADQTAAEIRTLVESASDSNVFTDADHTKLNGIEANATADQTNAEIKTAYEANSDTNAFTDAEKTKLSGVEANATADQTASEIRTLVESASDSNVFTDADHTKLNAIEASADVTDATNVDAAGAVMNSDLDGKGELLVGDGSGDPSALAVGTNNYVLTADSNEATGVKWAAAPGSSGGISNIVEDTTPQLGGNLASNGNNINIADSDYLQLGTNNDLWLYHASNNSYIAERGEGNLLIATNGARIDIAKQLWDGNDSEMMIQAVTDGAVFLYHNGSQKFQTSSLGVEVTGQITADSSSSEAAFIAKGDGSSQDGYLQLNCSQNSHGIKLKSPPHSAGASYTLTFPNTDGNANQVLKTDGSGGLDWVDQTTDTNTTYSAGTGLSLSSTTFNVDVGIADDKIVQMDDADAADNDYAKFTANGLEGRSYAEVKTDLSLNNVENTAISTFAGSTNITTLGTVATVTSTASGTPGVRKVYASTSSPSGGADGDIWIKYTA